MVKKVVECVFPWPSRVSLGGAGAVWSFGNAGQGPVWARCSAPTSAVASRKYTLGGLFDHSREKITSAMLGAAESFCAKQHAVGREE